ncbi:MAG TPA: PLP-dependent aminotransferase family protein [Acidimicrobiales bacterium]|nr:PLP-dependent aminotransferase family protein [Acidimicrobiales bacterium]
MKKTWSTSGLDLHLDVGGPRVRAALENALREAVVSGRLAADARLPSSRALAGDLGISRNTVAEAYAQLVAEGWLVATLGSGTYVAALRQPPRVRPQLAPPPSQIRYDLRPGTPDVSSFPRSDWLAAMRQALREAPDSAFGYGDLRGVPELRDALAAYLARARGVRADPNHVVVCAGFTSGLWLVCKALAARGSTSVVLEEYGLPSNSEVVADAGLTVRRVSVDGEGAAVEQLAGMPDVSAVLLTPAHQFPLGVALSPTRRSRLIEWATTHGGLIIEDDYDGEFRFDRQPLGALQGLSPQRVLYAGTASKTLAPGLRLAWLVVPDHLLDGVLAVKTLTNRQTSTVDQLALAAFIDNGRYDRHVRARRSAYRRRRDRLVEVMGRLPGQVSVTGIAAGLQAVVELPPACSEVAVVNLASQKGLAVEGLGAYGPCGDGEAGPNTRHRPALALGYANVPEHAFASALELLYEVIAEATGG